MSQVTPPTFDETNARITAAALQLHRALREALERVLPSVDGARACGRGLSLRRNLGWQVYAIARHADHASVISALPKARGWELVLASLESGGCPAKPLKTLREAIQNIKEQLGPRNANQPLLRAVADLLHAGSAPTRGTRSRCDHHEASRQGHPRVGA